MLPPPKRPQHRPDVVATVLVLLDAEVAAGGGGVLVGDALARDGNASRPAEGFEHEIAGPARRLDDAAREEQGLLAGVERVITEARAERALRLLACHQPLWPEIRDRRQQIGRAHV